MKRIEKMLPEKEIEFIKILENENSINIKKIGDLLLKTLKILKSFELDEFREFNLKCIITSILISQDYKNIESEKQAIKLKEQKMGFIDLFVNKNIIELKYVNLSYWKKIDFKKYTTLKEDKKKFFQFRSYLDEIYTSFNNELNWVDEDFGFGNLKTRMKEAEEQVKNYTLKEEIKDYIVILGVGQKVWIKKWSFIGSEYVVTEYIS